MNYGRKGIKHKKKLLNSATTKLGTKFGLFAVKLLLVIAVALVVSASCLAFGSIQGIIESAPDIASIDVSPEGYATKIFDCNENEIQTLSTEGSNRISVGIDQIPSNLQHAFIAIEDERFYEHNGIDIKGIMRAGALIFSSGKMSQGASTITQQLIKNNVFDGAFNETDIEKVKRKVQEQYLAVKLETKMSKNEILENYLNTISLGNGYYGVQAAANGYFNKDVSELTLSECAVIASITKSPTGLNPLKNPDRNRTRQLQVLSNMKEQGYISDEEYNEAVEDDVYARLQGIEVVNSNSTNSYFVDKVIDELVSDLMSQKGYTEAQATNLIYKGGLQVYTTQDMDMQNIADSVLNDPSYYPSRTEFSINYSLTVKDADGKYHYYNHNTLNTWFKSTQGMSNFSLTQTDEEKAQSYVDQYKEAMTADGGTVTYESLTYTMQPQISFTLMDQHTGYVKVIVGGRGEKTANRTLNRATNTTRQPGSSIKPLVAYGPGIDTGAISLASAIDDAPYYYSGTDAKLVKNYTEGDYRGLMTVREALAASQNVPAVKVLTQITPQVGFSYLEKFGLSTLVSPKNAINGNHDVVQSLALGGMTKGVTNMDMTAAYAAIANKGEYTKPIYYTKVLDSNGEVIIDNSQKETHRVLKETSAWLLTSAMESVITSGTGTAARLSNQPVAGKTGTTQFNTDSWFCAFTPYYTASIWTGYDDNSKTISVNHTRIWKDIMSQIHESLPTGTFEKPEDIVEAAVCSKSGKLPVEGLCDSDPRGSQIITEYFAADAVPTESCNTHVKVNICNVSGLVASSGCSSITTKIYIKKPASNTIGSNESGYTTKDAEYVITDETLSKICTMHKAGSSSSSGSSSTTKPTNSSTESTKKPSESSSANSSASSSSQNRAGSSQVNE